MEEQNTKPYADIQIGKEKDAVIEIRGAITPETLERHKRLVIKDLQKDFESPGFRKGHVPEAIVEKGIKNSHLLEETANSALRDVYPLIIEEHGLHVITPPDVTVTKLAFGNPLEFVLRVGVQPEIKLPDYKKIAKKVMGKESEETEIKDDQINEVIEELRRLRTPEGGTAPEITDEFVKSLGAFENVEDFKKKLRENITLEKELDLRKRKREELGKELTTAAKFPIPSLMIESELIAVRDGLYEEINKNGVSKGDYFARVGKTEEEFLSAQREAIERQFKMRMLLEAIAKEEHIEPTEDELQAEAAVLSARYRDVDPMTLLRYVTEMLRNEKTLQFLETQAK